MHVNASIIYSLRSETAAFLRAFRAATAAGSIRRNINR